MILLLGGSGYVGRAFAIHLNAHRIPFAQPAHGDLDATSKPAFQSMVDALAPRFVINAIGYTGRPNIDATEREKSRCLMANTVVPAVLAEVLGERGIPWGHVSSGCIFDGTRADGSAFTEEDAPNFAFGHPQASWYSRTKAMAETLLADFPNCLIWRLRIPFDQYDNERNYISKVMRYDRLLEVANSVSHLQEFAEVCIQTLLRGLPGGIYNVTNPGVLKTSEVADAVLRHGLCKKEFRFFENEESFLVAPGRVRRASCILSSEKIAALGLPLREVHEAMEWSLKNWQWNS